MRTIAIGEAGKERREPGRKPAVSPRLRAADRVVASGVTGRQFSGYLIGRHCVSKTKSFFAEQRPFSTIFACPKRHSRSSRAPPNRMPTSCGSISQRRCGVRAFSPFRLDRISIPAGLAACLGRSVRRDADETAPLGDSSIASPQPAMPAGRAATSARSWIIGASQEAARNGAEAVTAAYRSLPTVVDMADAAAGDAPRVDTRHPDNVRFRAIFGDRAATAAAAHVEEVAHAQNREFGAPIETRGQDPVEEKFTLHAMADMPRPVRNTFAKFRFFCAPEKIRVVPPRLGGGFDAKNVVYPEQMLVL